MTGIEMTQQEIQTSNQKISKELQTAMEQVPQKKSVNRKGPSPEALKKQAEAKEAGNRAFARGVAKQQWAGLEAIKGDIKYAPDKKAQKKHNTSKVKFHSRKDVRL